MAETSRDHALNLDSLVAIDVHVHAMRLNRDDEADAATQEIERGTEGYFGHRDHPTIDETAAYYRERSMACVIFPVDSRAGTGRIAIPNDDVLAACARNSDVLIPFASVDPWRGKAGEFEVRRLIADGAVRGFKFHPNTQRFFPNDRLAYPLYEAIAEAGLPALFHTGQTGIGAGLPGGGGIALKYSQPIHLDDVAIDFPTMPIIMAHPSVPWQEEALAVALHKPNVYIDLSGWSPKYFPPRLIQYANTLLKNKVLFGTDYPLLDVDRWLQDFEAASFKDEVRPKILRENAIRLLQL